MALEVLPVRLVQRSGAEVWRVQLGRPGRGLQGTAARALEAGKGHMKTMIYLGQRLDRIE